MCTKGETGSRRGAPPTARAVVGAILVSLSGPATAAPPRTPLPPPFYSFDLASPATAQGHVKADDVLALNFPYPVAVISGATLGLGMVGDDLDGISTGNAAFPADMPFALLFSVSRDTVGAAPPDPALVALGLPYNVFDQAARGHQAGDEYMSTRLFTRGGGPAPGQSSDNNTLVRNNYDEGGSDLSARPETSAQSFSAAPQDNVDALADASLPLGPYFSVTASSQSLSTLPGSGSPSGAHIFHSDLIQTSLFASYSALGLQQDDDIDDLIVFDLDANGVFDGADQVLFSLTPGSPSLGLIVGASASGAAADVFVAMPGSAPAVFAPAATLGLGAASDDIDGLAILPCADPAACITDHAIRLVPGDFDDDGDVDAADLDGFNGCLGNEDEPYPQGCAPGDFDKDGDVACSDWAAFLTAWTDPGTPPTPSPCANTIPAVSDVSLIVLGALLAAAGWVTLKRRNPATAE